MFNPSQPVYALVMGRWAWGPGEGDVLVGQAWLCKNNWNSYWPEAESVVPGANSKQHVVFHLLLLRRNILISRLGWNM